MELSSCQEKLSVLFETTQTKRWKSFSLAEQGEAVYVSRQLASRIPNQSSNYLRPVKERNNLTRNRRACEKKVPRLRHSCMANRKLVVFSPIREKLMTQRGFPVLSEHIYLFGMVLKLLLLQKTTSRSRLAVTAMNDDVTRPTVTDQWYSGAIYVLKTREFVS